MSVNCSSVLFYIDYHSAHILECSDIPTNNDAWSYAELFMQLGFPPAEYPHKVYEGNMTLQITLLAT
jgi:hypothetical protein